MYRIWGVFQNKAVYQKLVVSRICEVYLDGTVNLSCRMYHLLSIIQ